MPRTGLGVTNGLSNTGMPQPKLTFPYPGRRASGPPDGGRAADRPGGADQRHEDIALLVIEVSPTRSSTPEAKPAWG